MVTFGHMDYSQLVSGGYVKDTFDDFAFKFGFVRNPYDRAVSLYSYLQQCAGWRVPADQTFLGFCRELHLRNITPIGLYNSFNLSQCNPQIRWFENITMDYIGKIESIDEDVRAIWSTLGLSFDLITHDNKSRHSNYQEYYCCQSKKIVQDFYKEDFREFGYSEELLVDSCALPQESSATILPRD